MLAWRREQRRGELVVQAQHGAGSTFLCLAFGVGGDGGGASFSQFSLTPVFTFFELVPQAVSPAGTCAQLAVCDDPASTTCPAIRLSFVKDGHSANVVSYLWKHDDHTPSNPWEVPRFALGLVPDLGRRRLDVPCCKYGSRDGAECRPLRDAALVGDEEVLSAAELWDWDALNERLGGAAAVAEAALDRELRTCGRGSGLLWRF